MSDEKEGYMCMTGHLFRTSSGHVSLDDHNGESYCPPYDKIIATKTELEQALKRHDSSLAHNPQWLAENGLVRKEEAAKDEQVKEKVCVGLVDGLAEFMEHQHVHFNPKDNSDEQLLAVLGKEKFKDVYDVNSSYQFEEIKKDYYKEKARIALQSTRKEDSARAKGDDAIKARSNLIYDDKEAACEPANPAPSKEYPTCGQCKKELNTCDCPAPLKYEQKLEPFALDSKEEQNEFDEFRKNHMHKNIDKGAVGGGISIQFNMTGVGCFKTMICHTCHEVKDITDIENGVG